MESVTGPETTETTEPEEKASDRIAHIPLGLLEDLIDIGEPWEGRAIVDDESRVHYIFAMLQMRDWVIIYRTVKGIPDGVGDLRIRGFNTKDALQEYLATAFATEVAVDGIEMVLEKGRPRRFKLEVKPRIGF